MTIFCEYFCSQTIKSDVVLLTWRGAGGFSTDADRFAGVIEQRLCDLVVAEFDLDLLAHAVPVAHNLQTKWILNVVYGNTVVYSRHMTTRQSYPSHRRERTSYN